MKALLPPAIDHLVGTPIDYRQVRVVGDDQDRETNELQDEADADSLYDILQNQIIPLYYTDRSADNLPGDWVAVMKESIRTLTPRFSIQRMLKEYTERMYLPTEQ